MSFLAALVQRAQGVAPALREPPRQPAPLRYPAPDPIQVVTPVSPAAVAPPPDPAIPTRLSSASALRPPVPPSATPIAPLAAGPAGQPAPPLRMERGVDVLSPAPFVSRTAPAPTPTDLPAALHAGLTPGRLVDAIAPVERPDIRTPAAPLARMPPAEQPFPLLPTALLEPNAGVPPVMAAPRPPPAQPPLMVREAPGTPAQPRGAREAWGARLAAPQAPDILISIGRIDLHTDTPALPARPAASTRPRLSLEEHLRQRSGSRP